MLESNLRFSSFVFVFVAQDYSVKNYVFPQTGYLENTRGREHPFLKEYFQIRLRYLYFFLDAVLSARPIYARLESDHAGWCNAVLLALYFSV